MNRSYQPESNNSVDGIQDDEYRLETAANNVFNPFDQYIDYSKPKFLLSAPPRNEFEENFQARERMKFQYNHPFETPPAYFEPTYSVFENSHAKTPEQFREDQQHANTIFLGAGNSLAGSLQGALYMGRDTGNLLNEYALWQKDAILAGGVGLVDNLSSTVNGFSVLAPEGFGKNTLGTVADWGHDRADDGRSWISDEGLQAMRDTGLKGDLRKPWTWGLEENSSSEGARLNLHEFGGQIAVPFALSHVPLAGPVYDGVTLIGEADEEARQFVRDLVSATDEYGRPKIEGVTLYQQQIQAGKSPAEAIKFVEDSAAKKAVEIASDFSVANVVLPPRAERFVRGIKSPFASRTMRKLDFINDFLKDVTISVANEVEQRRELGDFEPGQIDPWSNTASTAVKAGVKSGVSSVGSSGGAGKPPHAASSAKSPAGDADYLAGVRTRQGSTRLRVIRTLALSLYGRIFLSMLEAGWILVHETPESLPGTNHPHGVRAMTDESGIIHLVAENLPLHKVEATFWHELFHLAGRDALGEPSWNRLMRRMALFAEKALEREVAGTKLPPPMQAWWDQALRRMIAANTPLDAVAEELTAYAIENLEDAPPGIKDLIGTIQEQLELWLLKAYRVADLAARTSR